MLNVLNGIIVSGLEIKNLFSKLSVSLLSNEVLEFKGIILSTLDYFIGHGNYFISLTMMM
jgi:hypothetical protein